MTDNTERKGQTQPNKAEQPAEKTVTLKVPAGVDPTLYAKKAEKAIERQESDMARREKYNAARGAARTRLVEAHKSEYNKYLAEEKAARGIKASA